MTALQPVNAPTASVAVNGSSLKRAEKEQAIYERPPRLDERFGLLKRQIISSEDERAVIDSYQRLKDALGTEADRIDREQQFAFPEVEWSTVVQNGYTNPLNPVSRYLPRY
jgi:hypothetical protein